MMEVPLNNFETKTFHFYGVRALISIVVIVIYLVAWRPVRIITTEQFIYPQVQQLQTEESNYRASMQSGAMIINYLYYDEIKELQYRPQFGFFMLVTLIALLFVAITPAPYWMLVAIHLLGSLFVYISLLVGAGGLSMGFVLADAISAYLVPGLSLALVPLVMREDFFEE